MLKTQFLEKKALCPMKKRTKFSRFIQLEKRRETIYRGIEGISTSFVQTLSPFLQDQRSREPNFSKYRLSWR